MKGNTVKLKYLLAATIIAFGSAILPLAAARADTVLYDSAGFLRGTQSFSQTFNLTAPGTLTVTLSNIAWPATLASLNLTMTSANGEMGQEMGAGTSSFAVVAGGDVFAQWFGTAQGALNAGVYGLKIEFAPSASVVPLPASIVLLFSGLALMMLWHRRRDVATAESATA